MPIRFRCVHCKQLLGIARRKAGTLVRCPKCQQQVLVPTALDAPASGPEAPAPDDSHSQVAPRASPSPPLNASAELERFNVPRFQARRLPLELIFALIAVAVLTAWYLNLAQTGIPRPGSLIGHCLGGIGLLLMLSTETLYSLRKRWPGFHWGRMSTWLQVHIFTGIVGSYLALLHSGGKFHGLAGLVALLTLIVVVSGFVGRYLYTAVPRGLDGAELGIHVLSDQLAGAERQLQGLGAAALDRKNVERKQRWLLILGRTFLYRQHRRRLHRELHELRFDSSVPLQQLEALLAQRYRLHLEIEALALTRRLLALWHICHVPLGVILFTLAIIHVGAALYFATLLK
jgi:hypothetical protein